MSDNVKYLIPLLKDVRHFLISQNIHWWLDCGTLLGLVRDKKLLDWESDLDIGVWKHEINESFEQAAFQFFKDKNYNINIRPNGICISKKHYVADLKYYTRLEKYATEYKFEPLNKLASLLRFFDYSLSSQYPPCPGPTKSKLKKAAMLSIITASQLLPSKIKLTLSKFIQKWLEKKGNKDVSETVPTHYFDKLSNLTYIDNNYCIPENFADYLAFRYGDNWQTPIKNWLTARDDNAFKLNKNIDK